MATHHARAHLKALVLNCKNILRPICSCFAAFELLCGSGVAPHPHPLCQSFVPSHSNAVPSVLAAKWFQCMSGTIF